MLFKEEKDRFSKKYLNLYQSNDETKAIELHCLNEMHLDILLNQDLKISEFSHISLHTPNFGYQKDGFSRKILDKITVITHKYDIKNLVFHVDNVKDWEIFNEYKTLPISIENMDDKKHFGKSIEEIKTILDKYNFNLTLDLQHCFVHDNSMKLALDFQNIFNERIVEYHISGLHKTIGHYPLFKTLQTQIIDSLKYKNLPIIIESSFEQIGEHIEEFEYIKNRLNKNN